MNVMRLDDCCEILDSMRVPITAKDRKAGPYPYYGANGIQDYVADYIFDDDLVLLAEDGGNFGSKEKPIAYRVSGKCWVNNHAHVLKPKPGMDVDYLCYSLMFYDTDGLVNGATRQKLTQTMMRKMHIPKRSIDEQRMIVNQLNKVLSIQKLYQKELSLLDVIMKARFIEMFGDPVKNEKGWPMVRLGELAEVKIGPFGSLLHREDYIEGGHALINPSHIVDGKIIIDSKLTISDAKYEELASYIMHIGDVVLGRRGEMGRCAVVDEEGYLCGTGSMILRSGKMMKPYFLQNIISSPSFRRIIEDKAVGVTMKNLNVPIVSELMIPKLPVNLQEQYLQLVEQSDKSKSVIQKSLDETQILFQSLMQEYFG
ncbi:restriction endonuclease subunit S [Mitsuokella jalaludinii]|uniref:restriction endonuclease subunit S n=1 Tax=Mitsuokella jalaludinii TaxID=187979 RepID=UPI003F9AA3CA